MFAVQPVWRKTLWGCVSQDAYPRFARPAGNGLAGENHVRPAEMVTLAEVHAELGKEPETFLVFHELGHGLLAQDVRDLVHGPHHGLITAVGVQVLYEAAVDFDNVHRSEEH